MNNLEAFSAELPDCRIDASPSGFLLLDEEDPIALAAILRLELDHPSGPSPTAHIGVGFSGRVNEVPGSDELCTKTTSPWLMRETYKSGHPAKPSNLALQMDYMDALRDRLDNTRQENPHAVHVPKHYLTATQQDGTASMLMERVDGAPIDRVFKLERGDHDVIEDRILQAVGRTVLKVGLNDIRRGISGGRLVNGGNILVDRSANSVADTPLDLIDLPDVRLYSRRYLTRAALHMARR